MPEQFIEHARDLRKRSTDAESMLWHHLRARQFFGLKFRRQQPIGGYIADFICFEKKIIIEVDGGQHADRLSQDRQRDAYLSRQGYSVLRFWNSDILQNMDGVLEYIGKSISG